MKKVLAKIWKILKLPAQVQLFFMRRINDAFLVGVTGIFLDEYNRVLLFKHTYRNAYAWGLPGGYLKAKEHPKEGLEREVKEETGLMVAAGNHIKTRTDRLSPRLDIIYEGKFIGGKFTPSHEVDDMKLVPFKELPPLPKDQILFIQRALRERLGHSTPLSTSFR